MQPCTFCLIIGREAVLAPTVRRSGLDRCVKSSNSGLDTVRFYCPRAAGPAFSNNFCRKKWHVTDFI